MGAGAKRVSNKPAEPNVTVAIATTGRCQIAAQTVKYLASLKDQPDRVVLSIADEGDIDASDLKGLPFPLSVVIGPKGSCRQRNIILDTMIESDIILFLDDDFLIAEGYISATRRLFNDHADVVMSTGLVLADGANGPGLTHTEGLAVLSAARQRPVEPKPEDAYSVYGCNMAVRVSTVVKHPERFDETLPLYAWLEDMDFSRRMALHGRIVMDQRMVGVHLGTKTGKSAGLLLGYSQIANPIYMIRKGTVRPAPVLKLIAKNILANLVKSVSPEPWIDRRGRLRGNALALLDLLRGKSSPTRILELM